MVRLNSEKPVFPIIFFRDGNTSKESENQAESDDVKVLIEFEGSSIL